MQKRFGLITSLDSGVEPLTLSDVFLDGILSPFPLLAASPDRLLALSGASKCVVLGLLSVDEGLGDLRTGTGDDCKIEPLVKDSP